MKRLLSFILIFCMIFAMLPAISADGTQNEIVYDIGSYMGVSNDTSVLFSSFTYEKTNGFWSYVANKRNLATVGGSSDLNFYPGKGLQMRPDRNWWAIKIYVPADGEYIPKIEYGKYKNIGDGNQNTVAGQSYDVTMNVYLFRAEKDTVSEADLTDSNLIGSVYCTDTACEAVTFGFYESFESVPLSEGEYYLAYFPKEGHVSSVMRAGAGNFTLIGGEKPVLMQAMIKSDKATLIEGESGKLSATVYMSDGSICRDAELTYTSDNPGVLSVNEETGRMTGVSEGKACVSVTAQKDGVLRTASLDIDVVDGNASCVKLTYDIAQFTGNGAVAFNTFTYKATNGLWQYAANRRNLATIGGSSDLNFYPGYGIQMRPDRNWWAMKINVPVSGDYTPVFEYGTNPNTEPVDIYVYMFKTDVAGTIESNLTEQNLIGKVACTDTTAAAGTFPEPAEFKRRNIEKGEWYLVYYPKSEKFTATSSSRAFVGNFTLDGGDVNRPVTWAYATVKDWKMSVNAFLSDGSVVPNDKITVRYSSDNPSVADVDARTGEISRLALGIANIAATVSDEYNTVTTEAVSIEVTELPMAASGVKEVYDFVFKSGAWTTKVNPNADSESDRDIRGITYEYTAADGNGNWEWNSGGGAENWVPDKNSVWMYQGDTAEHRTRISMRKDQWIAFNIKVPAIGRYNASLNYSAYNSSAGESEIYILPGDTEDIDAALTDNNKIGTVSYLDTAVSAYTIKEDELKAVEFETAGEYILVFKQTQNPATKYINLRKFRLDGVEGIKKLYAYPENSSLLYGETTGFEIVAKDFDGKTLFEDAYTLTFESLDEAIATVDKKTGTVTAIGDGTARIKVSASDGTATVTTVSEITVTDNSEIKETPLEMPEKLYTREVAKFSWNAVLTSENKIEIPSELITARYSPSGIVSIEDGMVTALSEGMVTVTLEAEFRGQYLEAEKQITVSLHEGKSEPAYYTYEKREIAAENIKNYTWAKDKQKAAVAAADKALSRYKTVYDLIPGEGVPRGRQVGSYNDPEYNLCRYCGTNIVGKYGSNGVGGWVVDMVNRPWKVQCPECKRLFPSNDFALLYERGLDEQGYYDRDRAIAANEAAVANGEKDALHNDLYPELYNTDSKLYNTDPRTGDAVDGTLWGVDDGWGYLPGRTYSNGIVERHGYVATYNYMAWDAIQDDIMDLVDAYVYTGDKKYGIAGAILTDRIADVYPSFNLRPYKSYFYNTHGGSGYGAIQGCIHDCELARDFCYATDAFYPVLSEPEVINFLSEKAEKYSLDNDKTSSLKIWENWETGILKWTFQMAQDGKINGNYGMAQLALSIAAISIDKEPETSEMIEWIYKTGSTSSTGKVSGGNLASQLIDVVDRDGFGNEASPNYNFTWISNIDAFARVLAMYKGDKDYNLYENPKFAQMYIAPSIISLADTHHAQIGDSGAVASAYFNSTAGVLLEGMRNLMDKTEYAKDIAKHLYIMSGYGKDGFAYNIFVRNPEQADEDVRSLSGESSELTSEMATGFGFAVLRDGMNYRSSSTLTANNNLRDVWMFFGRNGVSHAHNDALNIGIEAFGLNVAPDLGYPENTGDNPQRRQWVSATLSHNLVVVDGKNQEDIGVNGTPYHFDDSGKVKVMDVDASKAYPQTEEYRRTVVMVEADDDVSYSVDFFSVNGGSKHTFSFHSQAENAYPISGLTMTAQTDENGDYVGSYAGADVAYGNDPYTKATEYETKYPRGYTWLRDVRRDDNPSAQFTVEFDVKDYRKVLDDGSGIKLRMTQINNFTPSEVAIAGGMVPEKTSNSDIPETLDYVLVQREGENLDSLFTTVYEPYRNSPYIASIAPCEVTGENVTDENVRAVKVTHTSGRVDYIVYARDNSATYRVDDLFNFRGFVGVYMLNKEGLPIYRYVHDGDIIGDAAEDVSVYSGTVASYQDKLSFDNYIDVNMECEDLSLLTDKYIFIENDGVENGAYRIRNASDLGNGKIRLDIGLISVIRGHIDTENIDAGYVYNIKEGQKFTLPMSFVDENLPEFENISDLTTSAGSSVQAQIKATSPLPGVGITYKAVTLPRGASFNSDSGVLTWKPDASQIGDNHVAITAVDDDGREATVHFTITVYGSTTSSSSGSNRQDNATQTPDSSVSESMGASGGGGGGSSGQGSTDTSTDNVASDTPASGNETDGSDSNTEANDENVRFIDLGGHSWAADAINSLADGGVIKGTTHNTYSPALNITRADFALLLVRAFNLESDDTENFSDVSASDYFASELAIARNTGIVNGIGDNKYAPRNTITRQDMMVIVYRALQGLSVAVGDSSPEGRAKVDAPSQSLAATALPEGEPSGGADVQSAAEKYADYDVVAPYARDAVASLIGAGLVNGKNRRIAPTDYTTRAEVAVLIKRILEYTNEEEIK